MGRRMPATVTAGVQRCSAPAVGVPAQECGAKTIRVFGTLPCTYQGEPNPNQQDSEFTPNHGQMIPGYDFYDMARNVSRLI